MGCSGLPSATMETGSSITGAKVWKAPVELSIRPSRDRFWTIVIAESPALPERTAQIPSVEAFLPARAGSARDGLREFAGPTGLDRCANREKCVYSTLAT